MNILDYGPKFVKMREVGSVVTACLDVLKDFIVPGISTADINDKVYSFQQENKVENAQYHYQLNSATPPFPGYCCTSVNEVLCHGIPDPQRILEAGDIVKVDITFKKDGWHGDAARTYIVGGDGTKDAIDLVHTSEAALQIGIQQCYPGNKIGNIGRYIQDYIRHNHMYIAKDFIGHGIGQNFHENLAIPHILTEGYDSHVRMEPGMTFTIEPIIMLEKSKYKIKRDGWTVLGQSLAAQWEATMGITENGYEVFCK